MNLIAIEDLRRPWQLRERLSNEKELLLTSEGQPVAVLVSLTPSEDPEAIIQAVHDSRSRMALARIRESARNSGTSSMTMRDIDRARAAARRDRRARW